MLCKINEALRDIDESQVNISVDSYVANIAMSIVVKEGIVVYFTIIIIVPITL